MADIATWNLDGTEHNVAVATLRQEIVQGNANKRNFAIARFMELIPFNSSDKSKLVARGEIKLGDNQATNKVASATRVHCEDPALGKFVLIVPAKFMADLAPSKPELVINFDHDAVKLELPRLAENGMDRSMYQKVHSVRVSTDVAVTTLVDELDADKLTLIAVHLVPGFQMMMSTMAGITQNQAELSGLTFSKAAFDLGDACGGLGGGDNDWYVYKRKSDGICIVHEGTTLIGGPTAWTKFFGPGTKEEANAAWPNC